MSRPTLVMQVCPPSRVPRRDYRLVWYLAGSLAVHLGGWAVLEATPPEPPGVDVEWTGGEGTIIDVMPPDLPEPMCDFGPCGVLSEAWVGCRLGAPSPWSDYLQSPAPRDLSNPLYGPEGACRMGLFGADQPPCGYPDPAPGPMLGLEIRGPRYQLAHREPPFRSSARVVSTGIVLSTAGYDKAIVRRYLRRHLDEISACHEAPRLALHASAGDVAVMFFIAPTGVVQVSEGDGFDRNVARCVAKVIKTITFPRPAFGGGVQVRAPFRFQAPRD